MQNIEEKEDIIFSTGALKYYLGGWVKGSRGTLELYDDKIVFKVLFKKDFVIQANEIEEIKLTKVTGFINAGICITTKSGNSLRIYTFNRPELEHYLQKYVLSFS